MLLRRPEHVQLLEPRKVGDYFQCRNARRVRLRAKVWLKVPSDQT